MSLFLWLMVISQMFLLNILQHCISRTYKAFNIPLYTIKCIQVVLLFYFFILSILEQFHLVFGTIVSNFCLLKNKRMRPYNALERMHLITVNLLPVSCIMYNRSILFIKTKCILCGCVWTLCQAVCLFSALTNIIWRSSNEWSINMCRYFWN